MKLVTYQHVSGPRLGAIRDEQIVDLLQADPSLPADMLGLLDLGPDGLSRAAAALATAQVATAPVATAPVARGNPKLLAPLLRPKKVICIGLNYADHASETGKQPPPEPIVFNKFPTAVIGPETAIQLPGQSEKVDYEAELVAVIGLSGRNIPEHKALDHVAGYCCGNDVSARDWQVGKPGGQWLLGKTFDTFAPMGPALVTADEVGDPGNLGIRFRLNGTILQDSRTSELIFPVSSLISYLSEVITLEPGDVIFTGTPAGVGVARDPRVFLKPGDVAEVEIDHVGLLRNPVAQTQT